MLDRSPFDDRMNPPAKHSADKAFRPHFRIGPDVRALIPSSEMNLVANRIEVDRREGPVEQRCLHDYSCAQPCSAKEFCHGDPVWCDEKIGVGADGVNHGDER